MLYADAAQGGGVVSFNGRRLPDLAAAHRYTAGDVEAWRQVRDELLAGGIIAEEADGYRMPLVATATTEERREQNRDRQAALRTRRASVTPTSQEPLVVVESVIREEENQEQQTNPETTRLLSEAGVAGKPRRELSALPPAVVAEIVTKAKKGRPRNLAGVVVELCREEAKTGEIATRHAKAAQVLTAQLRQTVIARQAEAAAAGQVAREREETASLVEWWRTAEPAARQQIINLARARLGELAIAPLARDPQNLTPFLASCVQQEWKQYTAQAN
jgi:hypothetical protein